MYITTNHNYLIFVYIFTALTVPTEPPTTDAPTMQPNTTVAPESIVNRTIQVTLETNAEVTIKKESVVVVENAIHKKVTSCFSYVTA